MSADQRLLFRWVLLLALFVHAELYFPPLTNGFVFDDHAIVEGQPAVAGEKPVWGVISGTWFHSAREGRAIAYRPVALASGLVLAFGLLSKETAFATPLPLGAAVLLRPGEDSPWERLSSLAPAGIPGLQPSR